jgi:lipopolysaccharide export system ATP-binding protein
MALLEARGLEKWYGRRKVVDGVSFDVEAGEVVGLLGPNGAGKTTSFRMTTGQISPQGGKVLFNGEDVTHLPMFKRARLGMGYLSQEPSIFRKLTVEQNILAILEMLPASRSLGRKLSRAERNQRAEEVLEQFGLTRLARNSAARLSGGERRRLEIARCLVCEPLLILLDEPFTGIDPHAIYDIQQVVRDLRSRQIGILITDHNVRETLKITDRSYLIKDGQVRTKGSARELINDPIAIRDYLGNSFKEDIFGQPVSMPAADEWAPQPARETIPLAPPEYDLEPVQSVPFAVPEVPVSRPVTEGPSLALHLVVEQEKIHRWIEDLKTPARDVAAEELLRRSQASVPALVEALERRDVELRRQAFDLLQHIVEWAVFDPYAPESQRRQQLAAIRDKLGRKAG